MDNALTNLFSSGSFIPHGHCYLWQPGLVWLHLISDALIALAYYSIPITLFYFVRKRQDLPFHWIFLLFAAFIIACGTTHLAEIWTLWHPTYWLSGTLKAGTAMVSIFTALELIPLVPQALALPSPAQLDQANAFLQAQIEERLRIEQELRQFQNELEQRVQARTAELVQSNQQLQKEMEERQRIEAAFRKSEARFHRLVDANIIGVISATTDGAITEANDAFLKMTGYTRAEVLAGEVRWDEITPTELQHLDLSAIEELLTRGVTTPYQKEYFHKDGHRIPVLIGAALVEDDPENAISYVLDITELRKAEVTLRDSEERLRLALMAADQGLYDLNVQTGEALVSPEYARMLGYDPEEFQETNVWWRDRLHPDDVARVTQVYEDYIAGKLEIYRVEFRQRTKSKVWKWILSIGSIVSWDSQGQPLRMLGTHTDITDRKTAELEREQLLLREQIARADAESANRIKDEFLAVLSHELRSPLNPILGWSKLLQTGKLNEAETKQALATIERNAKLQSELIEDLLDVSRILQGKLSIMASPVNLATPIRAAMETVRLAAEAKSIQVEAILDSQVGSIMGDATRLQQVVWNLLSNAVKFTPTGGQVKIRLEQLEVGDKGNKEGVLSPSALTYAQITVSDSGKGIVPKFLPHVFDYFRQEDGATTRKFGGLGLGLAIVRQIVELHGGTVQVESQGEGLGATFTVRLPLMPIQSWVSSDPDFPSCSLDLSNIQVLAVDDEADSREFIAFVVEQAGARVRTATSATEAIATLTESQVDVLLSDIGMPETDGYMLMRQVRALPPDQGGQVKAIALTAYAGEFNQHQALQAGFQGHMAKPVEPQALIEAITQLMAETGQAELGLRTG